MNALAEAKAAARIAAAATRAAAHAAGAGAAEAAAGHVVVAIAGLPDVRVVAGYLPIRTEIDPRPAMTALHRLGYRICVPVVAGSGLPLTFRGWTPGAALIPGPFGVTVPAEGEPLEPDLLLAPLLAFDDVGHRLGYGGGYYDRTIAAMRGRGAGQAFGFAYAAQRVARVPCGRTDLALDGMITEAGFRRAL